MKIFTAVGALALVLPSIAAAVDYPAPKQGEWIARDFTFHTGEVMPEVKLHYTTIGEPTGAPVVVLHGTGGSARSMLTPAFAGELFGPASLSMRRSITSSSRMPWVTAAAPNPPTASSRNSRNTITPTWSMRNIGCCPKGSAFATSGSSSATRWAG
jgi:hypothetical protein